MLRALLSSFVLTLALLLAACGGGSGGDAASAPPSATASSNVVKGLIRNGVVTAWRWSEGAYVLVGSARTGENGDFSLAVQDPVPGEVLRLALDVSGDTRPGYRTEMLCDVAQCGSGVRGDWVPLTTGLGLTSWISVGGDGTLTVMPMTPVSTMLVRYAEDLGGGHLTAPTLEVARQRIAGLFKMTPEQLLVRPGNIANALWLDVASPEAIKVSLLSAAFAELSTASGYSIEQVLQHVATTFSQYDGHLMQDGETGSLGDVYRAMGAIIAAAGAPAVQSWVQDWITGVTAALQSDQLTTSACAPDCQPFDSNVFLEALGTGSDTLGGDLRRVMDEKGVETLEQLLAGELSRYGWLLSADSIALAQSAMQVVGASALSVLGMPLGAPAGLTLVREGDVLRFDGTINGLAIDLDVTLPPLLDTIQAYEPGATMAFVFGAQGTLQNERLRASINGTLAIDATGTDFAPLRDAIAAYVMASMGDDPNAVMLAQAGLLQAVGGILRAGQAEFTLDGSAGVARLELQGEALVETSRLAVAGKAGLQVDMDGLAGGGVKASGQVDHGSLELPNGDTFTVDPEQGHYLRFALAQHGTAELNIGVHILGHDATVSGSGTLAALGPLLSHLKDGIADQLQALTLDFTALATQFLTDARALALTVS
ncbi:MAG TPA: hypothetical protein VFV15_01090, partial [Moraxellaceae bacterium]|nr:hypothetical protein [Moraxellaceae bacterium]